MRVPTTAEQPTAAIQLRAPADHPAAIQADRLEAGVHLPSAAATPTALWAALRPSRRAQRILYTVGGITAVAVVLGATLGALLPKKKSAEAGPSPEGQLPAPLVCLHGAGTFPNATIDETSLAQLRANIDNIVLVVQENRPYDQYFAGLPAAGQPDADVAPMAGRPHATTYTLPCPNHDWNSIHRDYNNGSMDGFVRENAAPNNDGAYVNSYYTQNDLPFYYQIATTFATNDRYFSSVLSGTKPNRLFLYAGTSRGIAFNEVNFPTTVPTVFDQLTHAGVPWAVYSTSPAHFALDNAFTNDAPNNFTTKYAAHIKPIAQYYTDAQQGKLPPFAIVEPSHEADQADEHPPFSAALGQHFVQKFYEALNASPQWKKSAFILTYDEGGGFFDHVPPPPACKPDNFTPILRPADEPGDFDRYGIRVPFILASPHARKHYVSHVTHDHTSILRFIGARFDLPALGGRDANAAPLLDMFDF